MDRSAAVRTDVPLEIPGRYSFVVLVGAAVVVVRVWVLLPVCVCSGFRIPLSPYSRSSDICLMTDRFLRNIWDRSNRVWHHECRAIVGVRYIARIVSMDAFLQAGAEYAVRVVPRKRCLY